MCPDPCSLKDCEGDSKGLPGVMGLSQAGEGRVGVFLILRSLRLIRGQNNLGTNSRCPPARRTQPRGDVGGATRDLKRSLLRGPSSGGYWP